jgi:hypothetical protein
MSERCQSALREGADAIDVDTLPVHSGAGHETVRVAAVTDVGMLFVPSRDGVSHSPAERTDWNHCADGARVLAGGLATLARRGEGDDEVTSTGTDDEMRLTGTRRTTTGRTRTKRAAPR